MTRTMRRVPLMRVPGPHGGYRQHEKKMMNEKKQARNACVRKIGRTVRIEDRCTRALEFMRHDESDFATVTARGTGKLLGVVHRRALEAERHGATCRVFHHLEPDVRFVFQSDRPDAEVRAAAAAGPVVVVDAGLVPVGILLPEVAP